MSDTQTYAEHDADEVAAYTLEADETYPHERGATLCFEIISKNAYTCSINEERPEVIVTYVTPSEVSVQRADGVGETMIVKSWSKKRVASSFDIAVAILTVAGKKVKPEL